MKKLLSFTGILGLSILVLNSFNAGALPQDPPKSKKTERHIVMVKVDDDGNKTEIDTVLHGDEVFVWNGDTIGGKKDLKWIMKDANLDSIHINLDTDFEYEIDNDGEGNVFILKSGKGGKRIIREFKTKGDSGMVIDIDEDVLHGDGDDLLWFDRKSGNRILLHPPMPAPHAVFMQKRNSENIIDLSDPGIISYKKKTKKDGTEQITIVRKIPEKKNEEDIIMMHQPGDVMFTPSGDVTKKIRIIKSDDDGPEHENVRIEKSGDEDVKIIRKDGKKIMIKEIEENGEKKVDVKVEVEK